MLELVFILLFAAWPVVGLAILAVVSRRSPAGKPGTLLPAQGLTEVLARMYLWPIVLWRIRIARAGREQREG
jgi:hypothetical protein